jgi:hypothetical protein
MLRAKHLWRLHIGIRKTYPEYSSLCPCAGTCTESTRVIMISETDVAYIAGLFDGEGCVQVKKYTEKKKNHKSRKNPKGKGYRTTYTNRISMEIAMTDESVIYWVHDVLGVGSVRIKPRKGLRKNGTKYLTQYVWRCSFRDAYQVARLLWPYAQTKLHGIEKIIDHYEPDHVVNGKVVDLKKYKEAMSLE